MWHDRARLMRFTGARILARSRHFSSIDCHPTSEAKRYVQRQRHLPWPRREDHRPREPVAADRAAADHALSATGRAADPGEPQRPLSGFVRATIASPAGVAPGDGMAMAALCVVPYETIGEKPLEIRILLPHKTALWQRAFAHQVDHRAHSCGSRDLDRRIQTPPQGFAVDLLGEGLLRQADVLHSADGDEHEDDILVRHRHRSLEDVLQELPALTEAKVAD